ncbi:unnamed protein product [Camellia sinensis]
MFQRKKRLSNASIASSREQGRAKKNKLELLQCDLSVRSNISLEWDDKKKSVVAKREQIGLTQRDLIPFIGNVPHCHNILADVLVVPHEIFELDNLKGVLSYEVWQTHLSENERHYLTQFLPKGAETHQVVQELLSEDNFHFGNPFLKWGASLCYGNRHPDVVLHQEQCFKASKKVYYSELQKYHNGMIGNLLTWKEKLASCKNPEKEIVHKIWRIFCLQHGSRKQAERSIPVDANESRFHDAQEDLPATSESDSWDADEKAGSSDNQNLVRKHGELQKRKGFMEDKYDNLPAALKVMARPTKGEKLHKRNIQCSDGSKYMSYIKVSRKQHQRVKSSMKHSSNSIQSRSLNHVLGNLYTFHVQPFEVFEEEEQMKLHKHCVAVGNQRYSCSICKLEKVATTEMAIGTIFRARNGRKTKLYSGDKEKENAHSVLPGLMYNGAADHEAQIVEVEERENSDSLLREQIDGAENHKPAIALEDEEKENPDSLVQEMMDDEAAKHEPTIEDDVSTQNQHLQQIPTLSGSHNFCSMDLDSDNRVIIDGDDIHPNNVAYSENSKSVDIAVSQGDPLSSTSDVWPPVSMPDSYYRSTLNHEYASASELSLGHSRVFEQQQVRLIDLESDNCEEDTRKDLLHRQSNDGSFFNPYADQEVQGQNEVLQHFYKGQGGLPYHHEQKQTRLDLQPASNVSMEMGQFSGLFREHLHPSLPLELRQKSSNDMYMHQNIQGKMFTDGSRYTIPRQEHFSNANTNVQDWAINTNTTHMSAPFQSHLDGGELGRNWFSGEHQVRGDWSTLDTSAVGPTQTIINRSSNPDQSLFGVVSQCNQVRSGAPYDSMGSTEQRFIQSGTYGRVGAVVPTASNMLPPTAHPLDYLSGHEAAAPVKNNNIGWMSSVPHQNSALQDSIGKPFLRPSWNK